MGDCMDRTNDVTAQLKRMRGWRRLMWALLWTFFPVVYFLANLTQTQAMLWTAAGVWAVLFSSVMMRVILIGCPACQKQFHEAGPWARQCPYCKLNIYGVIETQAQKTI